MTLAIIERQYWCLSLMIAWLSTEFTFHLGETLSRFLFKSLKKFEMLHFLIDKIIFCMMNCVLKCILHNYF